MERHTAWRSYIRLERIAKAAIRVSVCYQRVDHCTRRTAEKFARKHCALEQTRVAPEEICRAFQGNLAFVHNAIVADGFGWVLNKSDINRASASEGWIPPGSHTPGSNVLGPRTRLLQRAWPVPDPWQLPPQAAESVENA
jgi:hypothetical protein